MDDFVIVECYLANGVPCGAIQRRKGQSAAKVQKLQARGWTSLLQEGFFRGPVEETYEKRKREGG